MSVSQQHASAPGSAQSSSVSTGISNQPFHPPPAGNTLPISTTTITNTDMAQIRFPSTCTRQRSSNININDAELEFQKTALSACRSTIAQQEAELKRLKESMEIRDKRILQLEAQIGHASEYISARDNPNDPTEISLKAMNEKISDMSQLLRHLYSNPANNIVINSCNHGHYQRQTSSTQTDNHPGDPMNVPQDDIIPGSPPCSLPSPTRAVHHPGGLVDAHHGASGQVNVFHQQPSL